MDKCDKKTLTYEQLNVLRDNLRKELYKYMSEDEEKCAVCGLIG